MAEGETGAGATNPDGSSTNGAGEKTADELKAEIAARDTKLAEEAEARRQITARAHRAEEEAKAAKAEADRLRGNSNLTNSLSSEDVDVKILQSQGKDEDTIKFLKDVAKLKNTSVLAAQSDELFVTWSEKREAKKRSEEASLGASRGSGSTTGEKSTKTPGLSAEEHREIWRKQNQG